MVKGEDNPNMGRIIGNWSQRDNAITAQEGAVEATDNVADKKAEQARLDEMRDEHQALKDLGW